MDLFNKRLDPPINLLSKQGIADYYGVLIPRSSADTYFSDLLGSIEWKHDEAIIYGKRIQTKRKVAWYGDKPYDYSYSGTTKKALPWLTTLRELKGIAEEASIETFNSCLLNLYHDGSEGMAWHSDGEKELKKNGAVASLSLGAERKFCFKHKQTKETISIVLEHGSLLVMKGLIQAYWLHRLPPTRVIDRPRVNLTFRTIDGYSTSP